MLLWLCFFPFFFLSSLNADCLHPIYCVGPILEAVQMHRIFPDSKTFVDMPTKVPQKQVFENWLKVNSSDRREVKSFVHRNFDKAGVDIINETPQDWKPNVTLFNGISDPKILQYARSVHSKWLFLMKKTDPSKICPQCESSTITLNNSFIVPGGRFRESYYWDSYWAILGLIQSEMFATAKNIILNFLDMINKFGFIPNGGRIYYLNRSQPPLLSEMVRVYYQATNDTQLIIDSVELLSIEYEWWMTNRSIAVPLKSPTANFALLNNFNVSSSHPRPESFKEDFDLVVNKTENEKIKIFAGIASAAETGWDFSSRWMNNDSYLESTDPSSLIPLDLNVMMYRMEKNIANFFSIKHNNLKATDIDASNESQLKRLRFRKAANIRRDAIHQYFWDNEKAGYFDFSLNSMSRIYQYYASTFSPLWGNATDPDIVNEQKIAQMFENLKEPLTKFPGGIPASLVDSKQQWDFPNGWAPLQDFAITGLENVQIGIYKDLAKDIAQKWITASYCIWLESGGSLYGDYSNPINLGKLSGYFFEKYNVEHLGIIGEGGEYDTQEGFGWTNGLILHILGKYGSDIKAPQQCKYKIGIHENSESKKFPGVIMLATITCLIFIAILLQVYQKCYRGKLWQLLLKRYTSFPSSPPNREYQLELSTLNV